MLLPAPIVLFAFNRPRHLQRTLDALTDNEFAAQSELFIYCDGPRGHKDQRQCAAVRKVAESARGFASVSLVMREKNWGLAANIIDGVGTVLERCERVIVLEDDHLTSPYFLRFMNEALDLYADDSKVASIHGWCFPHSVSNPPATFFLRGADCWGWATWRRAWKIFNPDVQALLDELHRRKLEYAFNINGTYDYMGMLEKAALGKNASWAVRWLASAFLADMYTLYSSSSLIENIGADGSGTHTGASDVFQVRTATAPVPLAKQKVLEDKRMHEAFQRFNLKTGSTPPGMSHKYALGNFLSRSRIKFLLKDWLPPALLRCFKRYTANNIEQNPRRSNVWREGYPDWSSACAAAGGYDTDEIFAKVLDASRRVRDGKAVFERDSVLFDHIEYSWPLLAGLMRQAARHEGALRLIDFGGSLGSTYRQNSYFLKGISEIRWNVVEQKHFVQCGQEEFQTEDLRFYESIEDCLAEQRVDGILFSSALQYLEDPYVFLEKTCSFGFDFLLLDRTPFSEDAERITVQHVPESIYKASYPCRFLDKKRIDAIISEHYDILEWFDDALGGPGWFGLIAERKKI